MFELTKKENFVLFKIGSLLIIPRKEKALP